MHSAACQTGKVGHSKYVRTKISLHADETSHNYTVEKSNTGNCAFIRI